MSKTFRPWNPEQTLLLAPSPVDWLPENHLVFFLLDLAAELDLGAIHIYYSQKDPRGEKAYDPRRLVVLLLYAYCVGLPSSWKLKKACWADAAFRVLTGNQQPDHSRISDFWRRHLDALKGLFVQTLRLCQKAEMVSLGLVALDGTKVKANSSKHKAMSHERMLRSERQLEGEMRALLCKAELIDAQEVGQYGKGKRAARRARGARKRADDAQRLAIEKAEAAGDELLIPLADKPADLRAMPHRMIPSDAAGTPRAQAQRNFTDPDGHIFKGSRRLDRFRSRGLEKVNGKGA